MNPLVAYPLMALEFAPSRLPPSMADSKAVVTSPQATPYVSTRPVLFEDIVKPPFKRVQQHPGNMMVESNESIPVVLDPVGSLVDNDGFFFADIPAAV